MRAFTPLIDLLYPPACSICSAPLPEISRRPDAWRDAVACANCRCAMRPTARPVCQRCGLPINGAFDAELCCAACRQRPFLFERARAPWQYLGPMQTAVRRFKYHRRGTLGRWMAEEMAQTARRAFPIEQIDAIVPVPLHWIKRHLRGFNPAEELARELAHLLQRPYAPQALRRRRWTATQTALGWHARRRNVRGAFAARPSLVRRRTVLLVDDVLTSGATANACARALRAAGARRVWVLAAARTPQTDGSGRP